MTKERCDVLYNQEQWDEAQAEIERLKTLVGHYMTALEGIESRAAKALRSPAQ